MSSKTPFHLALVSMPWALFNRPSVQLGTLQSYLEQDTELRVKCLHPYLHVAQAIGTEAYTFLSKNGWAGDALFSSLLFPENSNQAETLFNECSKKNKEVTGKFQDIRAIIEQVIHEWIVRSEFQNYSLVGFSVCFNQLFSSLFAAHLIKQNTPEVKIVFGGSSCVDNMGRSILSTFSQVDYVIGGEGEIPLYDLCLALKNKSLHEDTPSSRYLQSDREIKDLDSLPTPKFNNYFEELAISFPGQPFNPTIPIEFSRGCWWNKCSFCNLNLQWNRYRSKSAEKMVTEIRNLFNTHGCLDFTFCDNALPPRETDSFFTQIENWGLDIQFFAEIRAINSRSSLSLYRRGGLKSVQVGIESLSTSLLQKMEKGTSTIENLSIMKQCSENEITLDGNLIVEFPGSTQEEVQETLKNLDYALYFHPLSAASFFLGAGSPIETCPSQYGIQSIIRHKNDPLLFPKNTLKSIDSLIKDYRGDRVFQRKMWRPVRKKIEMWQSFHNKRKQTKQPPLSYRDGGTFIVIRQERPEAAPLLHRLRGASREIYLFCSEIREIQEIEHTFPKISPKMLLNFFADLSNKRLLYMENNKVLSLAIRQK